jgi:hypothetical protein
MSEPEYARGGYIESHGPLPDHLLGDPGFVFTAEQVKRFGTKLLDQLNEKVRPDDEAQR